MNQYEKEIYADERVTVYSITEQEQARQRMEQRHAARKYAAVRRSRRQQAFVLGVLMSLVVVVLGACALSGSTRPEIYTLPEPVAPTIGVIEQTLAASDTSGEHLAVPSAAPEPTPSTTPASTEAVLLAQGYYSDAVPMEYEYQGYMREYCEKYACPYPLALAVAEVESNFDMGAVGLTGEVGIMQLNPGPLGSYHDELEAATGLDPMTAEGNIACGCYLLGKYLAIYGDTTKAVMAYNMGQEGAAEAWASGQTSSYYSELVMDAVQKWSNTVLGWSGN